MVTFGNLKNKNMISISKQENKNYLAKVVEIKKLVEIEGADRIQVAVIDFQDVIVSKDVQIGDLMVYFPVECAINKDFLSKANVFRDSSLNEDKEAKGFFDEKGRVKAIKMLKGTVKSMGYVVPVQDVLKWANGGQEMTYAPEDILNESFDTINGKLLVEKYQVKKKESRNKQGKQPQVSRLIDGQVHLHVDTENLRRNAHKIHPEDLISVTYKTHGTSWWVGNVLVKKPLHWLERILKRLGVNIIDTEYDIIYGSRRVVKNKAMKDPKAQDHFFGYDLWEDIKEFVKEDLPKGFTLYGEMLGYDRNGQAIQKKFDYGCVPNGVAFASTSPDESLQSKLEVYRITHTNTDGVVTELDYPQIQQFCERLGLKAPHLYFYGKAKDLFNDIDTSEHWNENFVKRLEEVFNDKNCFMCVNEVPEEGIVVRKESLLSCDSYKLKSFRFLEWESKELDKGESDIESEN